MNKNTVARKLAFCGLLLAFNSIIFMIVNILDTNTLALMVISSFLIAVIIIEIGLKYASIYFLCISLLAIILINDKLRTIVYISSMANYGIVKFFIESRFPIKHSTINKNFIFLIKSIFNRQTPIKLLYANVVLLLIYFEIQAITGFPNLSSGYLMLAFFVYQLGFLAYDYIFSLSIDFYYSSIRKRISFFN